MPSSYIENIPPIMKCIERMAPKSVLDVGTGFGKMAFLIRERVDSFTWEMTIDGVEVWPEYLERMAKDNGTIWSPYDRLYFQDFNEVTTSSCYDVVLMIDVLEHFTFHDGLDALKKACLMSKAVLISTPQGYLQGAVGGNEYETHRSEWTESTLRQYCSDRGYLYEKINGGTEDSVICLIMP